MQVCPPTPCWTAGMRGAGWPGNKASHSCSPFTRGSWVTTNTKVQFINHDCKVNISTGVPFAKFTHLRSYIAHGHACSITSKTTWPGAPPAACCCWGATTGPPSPSSRTTRATPAPPQPTLAASSWSITRSRLKNLFLQEIIFCNQ